MGNSKTIRKFARRSLSLIGTALVSASALANPPVAFEAHYTLYRNGKAFGESELTLQWHGEQWALHDQSKGTHGIARFLGVREETESNGLWQDGWPVPKQFQQKIRVFGKHLGWEATFDWSGAVVKTVYKDGKASLPLQPGVVDPSSLGLAIRAGLVAGQDEWHVNMVDEDEISADLYRATGIEAVKTDLGCMTASRVEKIRDPENKRYTRMYYARDFAFVPIKIEHGKIDGDHLESRLVSLSLNQQPVAAGQSCEG